MQANNLSGGGMLLLADHIPNLREGEKIGVEFQLDLEGKRHPILTEAIVVRMNPAERADQDGNLFEYAIKFADIKEKDLQLLIQYLFDHQKLGGEDARE